MIYKIKYIAFPLCFVLLMLFINSSTFYMPVNVSVELKTNKADMYQLFYDTGKGFNEAESITLQNTPDKDKEFQDLVFKIPAVNLRCIRIDTGVEPGALIEIRKISLLTRYHEVIFLPEDIIKEFSPFLNYSKSEIKNNTLFLRTSGNDPRFVYNGNISQKIPVLDAQKKLWSMFRFGLYFAGIYVIGVILCILFWNRLNKILISFSKSTIIQWSCKSKMVKKMLGSDLLLFIAILLISIIAYIKFIIGDRLYIYNWDIASDNFFQFYPYLSCLSEKITSFSAPLWTFNAGLGSNISYFFLNDVFSVIPMLFGPRNMPYILVYMQILKIILSGVFINKFFRLLNLSRYASFIGAILYAFSGHIIARGQWYSYSSEAVMVALALWAFERYLKFNKKSFFIFSTALLLITQGNPYYACLYALLLGIYATARFINKSKFNLYDFAIYVGQILLMYFLSIGISLIFMWPGIVTTLASPRFDTRGMFTKIIQNIGFYPSILYETTFARLFSGDIMGVNNFSGWVNYLEAPILYCGVICILLGLQFFNKNTFKEQKGIYVLVLVALLYLIFPAVKLIFNGTSHISYKLSSFWISILIIYMSIYSLDNIINRKKMLNKSVFFIAIFISLIFLLLDRNLTNALTRILSITLIIIYSLLLYIYVSSDSSLIRKFTRIFLISLVCVEATLTTFSNVNLNRCNFLKSDLVTKKYYNDSTVNAISFIENQEKYLFYRVGKTYISVFLCDSLMQNYHGTKNYGMNSKEILAFYNEMYLSEDYHGGSYMNWDDTRSRIDSIISMKYLLSNDSRKVDKDWYELVGITENIRIYKNKEFIPFGAVFDSYISSQDFSRKNLAEKEQILIGSAVIDSELINLVKKDESLHELDQKFPNLEYIDIDAHICSSNINIRTNEFPSKLIFNAISPDFFIEVPTGLGNMSHDYVITFKLNSCAETIGQVFWKSEKKYDYNEEQSRVFPIKRGIEDYVIYIPSTNTDKIKITFGPNIAEYSLYELKIATNVTQQSKEMIENRNNIFLHIEKFEDTNMKGYISLGKSTIMFLSIPYDKGWRLKVDGKDHPLYKMNIGFMGTILTKGNHIIELSYSLQYWKLILSISGISIIFLFVLILKEREYILK